MLELSKNWNHESSDSSFTDYSWRFRVVVKVETTATCGNFCLEVQVKELQLRKQACFPGNEGSRIQDYDIYVADSVKYFAKRSWWKLFEYFASVILFHASSQAINDVQTVSVWKSIARLLLYRAYNAFQLHVFRRNKTVCLVPITINKSKYRG